MTRQLNLDRDKIEQCYDLAGQIISNAAKYIDRHSSPAVERATLMLLGCDADYKGYATASLLVEKLTKDELRLGGAHWWGKALVANPNEAPAQIAEKLARGKIKWSDLPDVPAAEIRKVTEKLAREGFQKWEGFRRKPEASFKFTSGAQPFLALHFQEKKPKKLASLAQDWKKQNVSLNLSELVSKEFFNDRFYMSDLKTAWTPRAEYKTVPVTQGLSTPEQALLALSLGLPAVELDGWAPAIKGRIDAKRSLIDHSFALSLCGAFPIQILNELFELQQPLLLVHLLLYEQLARRYGVSFDNVMLAIAPDRERGVAGAFAFAQVLREMFSKSPIWYALSKKNDPFTAVTAMIADLDVLLVDAASEKVDQIRNWLKEADGIEDALMVNTHGRIGREAHLVLDQAWKELHQLQHMTVWKALEENEKKSTVGAEGIFQKSIHYWNPVADLLNKRLADRD